MTVKQLIAELSDCDEDILDFEIGIIVTTQLTDSARLSVKCRSITIQENVDIANKVWWLKGKE